MPESRASRRMPVIVALVATGLSINLAPGLAPGFAYLPADEQTGPPADSSTGSAPTVPAPVAPPTVAPPAIGSAAPAAPPAPPAPAAPPTPAASAPPATPPSGTAGGAAGSTAGSSAGATPGPSSGIAFNFKGATWDQVLDFFARQTGLPIVRETPAPDGVVDYLSPRSYSLAESLEVLNTLLQTRGVMLRAESDKLFLAKLEDMKRENIPTFVGKLPENVTSDQIVTLVLPLRNAAAKPIAEQLAQMVAAYGSVTAMEKQNALIIVETAAQIRRLEQIVAQLDEEDVENVVEYIPIKHAKATELVNSLTALMGERVVEYVINPQNNQKVKLEENRLGGMTIAADARTNAIIARGTRAKVDQLKDTIKLLDVPGADDRRAMRTFDLRRLTPQEFTAQLTQLFGQLPPRERPSIIPSPDALRVTVVGSEQAIAESAELLLQLDPPAVDARASDQPLVAVLALEHAAADAAAATARSILGRQAPTLTLTPGPDQRSIVLSGPASQVEAAKAVLSAIDRPGRSDRQVRLVRISGDDPATTLARAVDLYARQIEPDDEKAVVASTLEPSTGSVVLVGESQALARFAALLDQVQAAKGPQPDIRVIELQHARAADVAGFLAGLARGPLGEMVQNAAPGAAEPQIEVIEPTNSLVVAAQPAQQQVIDAIVRTLDVPRETALPPMRILQLRTADAVTLASTLNATYGKRTVAEREAKPVSITPDAQTNTMLVAAHPDMLPEIEALVNELNESNRTSAEDREIRIFPLKVARAAELARTIDEMFPPPPVPVDPRGRPRPELQKPREVVVRADAQTNALIVDAPVQRMSGFQELVEALDRQELGVETQIRTWRLRNADVNAAAQTLRQLAESGTLGGSGAAGRRTPVTVSVEPATRTLVVAGPAEIFAKVDEVLQGLDERKAMPATTLRFFKLSSAKAESLAPMLREVLSARLAEEGAAAAELQALLKVTADRKTNSLIVSAPESLMAAAEELVRQLDSSASAAGEEDPIIRVRPLTFADAREVSASLSQALPGLISKATGEPVNVRLIPSASANAMVLVGPEADLKEVEALIEPLDARPALDAVDARTFELKHAEASRIAPIVQNLLADQQETDPRIVLERLRRSRGQIDTTPRVRVEADPRTNRLIVSGPQRTVALAETLIGELDKADQAADRAVRTFTPAHAEGSVLAQTARQVIEQLRPSGQRTTLSIVPEPQSGSLLLVGTQGEVDQALELLRSWDAQALVAPAMDLKLLTLANADARVVGPAVAGLLQDRTRWPEELRAAVKAGLAVGQPTVSPDAASNRLLVSAPTALLPLAEQLVKELDQPREAEGAVEVRTFSLTTADATGVANAVRAALDSRAAARPGEPKASVMAEPSSNALVVAATPEQLSQVERVVSGLDAGTPRDQAQVRTIVLRHSRASEVAPLVETLLADKDLIDPKSLPGWAQAEYMRVRQQIRGDRPEVRVAADERLNAIVVAAPATILDAAEAVVAQLDVPEVGDGAAARSVRLLTLRNADAAAVAESLEAIFAEEKDRERPPTIRVDAASNGLLVRATEAQYATIAEVVARIDDASVSVNRQITTVPIDGGKVDAREVAEMLRRLLGESGDGAPKVEVISLEELLKREAGAKKSSRGPDASEGPGQSSRPAVLASLPAAVALLVVAADSESPDVTIAVDERTNSLVLVGSPRAVERLAALARQAQEQVPAAPSSLRVVTLDREMDPERLRTLVNQILARITPAGGRPGDLARRVAVLADADLNALVIAASDRDFKEVAAILSAVGKAPVAGDVPVRTITLERAAAGAVAGAIQRFYDERARLGAGGRAQRDVKRVAVVGDPSSNTLLVAAGDEDFAEVQSIVSQLDSPQSASALELRIFPLKHARATEIERTVQSLVGELTWNQPFSFFGPRASEASRRDAVAVRAEPRLNAMLVTGTGDKFKLVEQIVETLDVPPSTDTARVVRLYPIQHASIDVVGQVVRDAISVREQRPWEVADSTAARVRVDPRTRTLIVVGSEAQQKEVTAVLAGLDRPAGERPQTTEVVRVQFARAAELAEVLGAFLRDRAAAAGEGEPKATIVPSDSANTLLLAGSDQEVATLRDLISRLDEPGTGGDRRIEIIALREARADELSRLLAQQFPRSGGSATGVVVSPDVRTNTVVVNAPAAIFPQVKALVERLDATSIDEATVIRTYALTGARAEEAARLLSQSLELDARGQTPTEGALVRLDDAGSEPVRVRARVVADRRSNSLVVTATPESFPVIEALVKRLDAVPARSPVEYRLVRLQHALADEVSFTLRQVVRGTPDEPAPRIDYDPKQNTLVIAATADQFEQIDAIVTQIDVPSPRTRQTEFVTLKFADAEKVREALRYFYGPWAIDAATPGSQSVVIVADPASNSLVISAEEAEWAGIRGLVEKLDSEEYDASQQLRVYALLYADSQSVARAINEAFQGRIEQRERLGAARRGEGAGGGQEDPRRQSQPAVLVESNDWVNAAAESQTNSIVVSASRQNLAKIERIIEQIDTPDFAKLPPPRLIAVRTGNPTQLAETLTRMFAPDPSERGGRAAARGLRIAGDVTTGTLLVRAGEEEFAQVQALADALQQESDRQGLSVKILPLKAAPAARVASALREAFGAKARQQNLPLSISVDAAGNALVVASSGPMFDEVKAAVDEMDRLAPTAGQAIFVIELQNIAPEAAKSVIENIGLDKAQPETSAARLVVEPVKVSLLPGRRAIVVVASPADRETIVGLLKAVDSEPALAESRMRIVKLENADAAALATLLGQILTQSPQQSASALAKAVAEQVRRLNVRRDGLNEPDIALDLTKPIRIVPDAGQNALILASTPENVSALEELVRTFDTLPVTDAVTVQIFPLENIAAEQFARIVRELFQQGKNLATRPGGRVAAGAVVPAGTVGKALLDSIAITVDDRTNTVVVAGKEDSVALVEVLVKRLDGEVAAGWVEPRVIPLRYADAEELAATLQSLLTESTAGASAGTPTPLQKQVARLRMMRRNGGQVPQPDEVIEADFYQPMTRTVIKAEPHMNALVAVATAANLDVIAEMVRLLDVEAASPVATVRVYPVQHASAAKLAATIQRVFEQQFAAKAIRAEDRVAAQADERTNSLVVSTSPRSFAVLEALLASLDSPLAPDLREIRTIEVKSASAQRLAPMIQQLMDARLERLRKVQPETAELERVLVIPDARSNALVVAAAADAFEVVRRLVSDLDSANVVDTSLVRVITLEKANADRIAAAIRSILERRYADLPPEVRSSQRPLVLVDQRSNSLLVAAPEEDYAMIADLARKLESAPVNPAVGVNVVPLLAGRAETLAPRLETIMQQRRQSLGTAATPGDLVSIQPDPGSNALIVAASDENLQTIRQLVEVLGRAEEESGGQSFEMLQLAASRAVDLIPVINEMYVAEENRRRGANAVRVAAETRLNAVLVTGDPGDVQAVRDLVARLDGARPETVVEIKYVPLAGGNAIEMVALLESILGGRGLNGRPGRSATVLKYMGPDAVGAPEEATVSTAIRESINLTPDVRTNTIIVSAPRDSMAMIERMIRDLDASTTGAQNIRIFKLANADAQAMADILSTLFNMERRGDLLVLKPREAMGIDGGDGAAAPGAGPAPAGPAPVVGLGGIELTAVPDERQQLSITIDSRTNSLLVSATPTYLDLVEQVVKELDAQEANERETFVYSLKNAVAADVARVVSQFVAEDQRKIIQTLGSDQLPSAARLLEREVTIVGDEKTNTVLINASPRYMAKVEEIIRELDVDPPQVLIQVLLAEVALDATDEAGVDMSVTIDAGDYTLGGGFGLASVAATSVGLPAVPFANMPFISVAGPDFNLLIKAMQSQGRLQVLSNPSVMAANNEVANIQIGETVQLPQSTSFTSGQQQSSVVPEDIGVILKVTPSINPEGFVRMEINPEISELSQRTTQISENFFAPIVTRRRANTTITVKDGETVVLGGLISNRYEKRGNKVPILGDIPGLGFFFRRDIETVAKTELLIVLTPHVVMSPSQLDKRRAKDLTIEQIDRLSVPDWIKDQMRKGQLQGVGGLFDADGRPIEPSGINRLDPSNLRQKLQPTPPPPGPANESQQEGNLPSLPD